MFHRNPCLHFFIKMYFLHREYSWHQKHFLLCSINCTMLMITLRFLLHGLQMVFYTHTLSYLHNGKVSYTADFRQADNFLQPSSCQKSSGQRFIVCSIKQTVVSKQDRGHWWFSHPLFIKVMLQGMTQKMISLFRELINLPLPLIFSSLTCTCCLELH